MSLRTALLAMVALGVARTSWAANVPEAFPYTAYITSDDVQARSGPGKNFYATSKLERGATVEIYRHDPGGWYAIRPPEGSFSWVSSKFLEIKGEGVAVVTAPRVAARVGTDMSEVRDVIQVQLDQGEEVRVLEARRIGTGTSAQTWYKIAPPAGEFRWVFGRYVGREPPVQPVAVRDARRNRLIETPKEDNNEESALEAPGQEAEQLADADEDRGAPRRLSATDAEPIDGAEQGEPRRRPRDEDEREDRTEDEASERRPAQVEDPEVRKVADRRLMTRTPILNRNRGSESRPYEPIEDTRDYDRSARRAPERVASRYEEDYRNFDEGSSDRGSDRGRSVRSMSPDEQNEEIDRLNEDLARTVTRPSNQWALTGVLNQAQDLMQLADTAVVRARARRLLEQAERFEDIRRRQLGIAQPSAVARHSNLPVLGSRKETTFDRLGVGSGALPTASNLASAERNGDRYAADRYADRSPSSDRYSDRYEDRYDRDAPGRPNTPRGPSAEETAGRFDGTGKLTPVLSQKIGEPHFALVDERGSVRYYVTAAPGVNLRRYVGQDVGITGSRAFNPELNSEHLTARRIFPLEGARTLY